jgi:hypothetical protein
MLSTFGIDSKLKLPSGVERQEEFCVLLLGAVASTKSQIDHARSAYTTTNTGGDIAIGDASCAWQQPPALVKRVAVTHDVLCRKLSRMSVPQMMTIFDLEWIHQRGPHHNILPLTGWCVPRSFLDSELKYYPPLNRLRTASCSNIL